MPVYAGLGSRRTPAGVLRFIGELAVRLGAAGWTVRAGALPGPETAFERAAAGAGVPYELYLPWAGFEYRAAATLTEPQPAAYELVAEHHPAWGTLPPAGQRLAARAAHLILGPDLTAPAPVSFVLCWTPLAQCGGSTSTALRVAAAHGIEIRDLAHMPTRMRCRQFLGAPPLPVGVDHPGQIGWLPDAGRSAA
jgi:hypothetical protein